MGKIIRDTGSEIIKPIPTTGTTTLTSITRNIDDKVLTFIPPKKLYKLQPNGGGLRNEDDLSSVGHSHALVISNVGDGGWYRQTVCGYNDIYLKYARDMGQTNWAGTENAIDMQLALTNKIILTVAIGSGRPYSDPARFTDHTLTITRNADKSITVVGDGTTVRLASGNHGVIKEYTVPNAWLRLWAEVKDDIIWLKFNGGTAHASAATLLIKEVEIFS